MSTMKSRDGSRKRKTLKVLTDLVVVTRGRYEENVNVKLGSFLDPCGIRNTLFLRASGLEVGVPAIHFNYMERPSMALVERFNLTAPLLKKLLWKLR